MKERIEGMGKTAGIVLTGLIGSGLLLVLWFGLSQRSGTGEAADPGKSPEKETPTSNAETGDNRELLARIDDLKFRLEQSESEIDRLKKERREPARKEKAIDPAEGKKAKAKAKKKFAGKGFEKGLGLSGEARERLEPLITDWKEEDKLVTPDETVWRTREAQLRGMLSEEERTLMHETLVERAEETWSWVAPKVGTMTGIPSSNWGQMRESMGRLEIPPDALLSRAHGLHWTGLLERAAPLMEPHLTVEQADQLQGIIQNRAGK